MILELWCENSSYIHKWYKINCVIKVHNSSCGAMVLMTLSAQAQPCPIMLWGNWLIAEDFVYFNNFV